MYGIDVSRWQKGLIFTQENLDFVFIKASEGNNSKANELENFISQAKQLPNLLVGFYHYARPDLHGTIEGMEQEAEFFCETVKSNWSGPSVMVLDWEHPPFNRNDLIEAFCTKVESIMNRPCVIYGSASKLRSWKTYSSVIKRPLWMAAWQWSISPVLFGTKAPVENLNGDINWLIWQYASTGIYGTFSDNVDLDYTEMTREEWLKLAGETEVKEDLTSSMQWAIENKLIYGDGQGNYRPHDPMTREEMVAVLRRYNRTVPGHTLPD